MASIAKRLAELQALVEELENTLMARDAEIVALRVRIAELEAQRPGFYWDRFTWDSEQPSP